MGQAAPIIGLATQGLGMFAGGGGSQTVYQPNPRAKYESDLALIARAEENSKLAEDILRSQTQTQEGFAKYQYDQQNMLIDQETQMAMNNVEAQYNMGIFQQSMQRLANEADRYTQLTSQQMQRQQNQRQYEDTLARLGIQSDDIGVAERNLGIDRAGVDAGYNRSREGIQNQRQQLAQGAESDKFKLSQTKKQISLQQAGLTDARTNLQYQSQGIDLAQIQSDAQFSQELQALSSQDSKLDVQSQIAKANAEQTRKEALRQLSLDIAGNERDAQAFYNQLVGGQGFSSDSASIAAVQGQLVDNERTQANRESLMDRYGMQLGLADIQRDVGRGDVAQGRRNTVQGKNISDQQLANQRGNVGLGYSGIEQQQQGLELAGQQADYSFQQAQAARALQAQELAQQEQYDLLSKSLLPNAQLDLAMQGLQNQRAGVELGQEGAQFALGQGDLQAGAQEQQFAAGQGIQEAQMGLSEDAMMPVFSNQLGQYRDQKMLNEASNFANYQQQLGATKLGQSAGLNQIASQQHGLLSALGGYQNPAPAGGGGGGGIPWGGIGKFGQSLMGVLGGMGGGGSQGGGGFPAVQPGFTPTAYSYTGTPNNYSGSMSYNGGF